MATKTQYINYKFPLRSFRKGFFESNETTVDAVREDLKILLLTAKGERVINPDIGTNVRTVAGELFNQIDKSSMKLRITDEITSAIERWMPHIKLTKLDILTIDDNPQLRVNDILIKMKIEMRNAETATDSVQLLITV